MSICITPQSCLLESLDSVWGGLADGVRTAAGEMITQLFGWWTRPASTSVDTAFVHLGQRYVTTWIAVPIAVLAMFAAVGWGVVGGGHSWVSDTFRGLIMFGVVAGGSVPLIAALQLWSSSLSRGLLAAVPTGDVGARFLDLLRLTNTSPLTLIFWSLLVFLAGAVQYLIMLFRDGAVLVLTVVLPIAAAGQFSRGSALWLPKVTGWLLAFIFLKPAAALIYFVGLSAFGQSTGIQALATSLCVMISAILALPAMLRLVTFAVSPASMHTNALALGATVAGVGASAAQLLSRRSGGGPSGAVPTQASAAAGAGPAGPVAAGAINAISSARTGAAQAVSPQEEHQ